MLGLPSEKGQGHGTGLQPPPSLRRGHQPLGRATHSRADTPPLTPVGGTLCLLKVTIPVLAEGLEDHSADSHEWLHHAELQGGLVGEKVKSRGRAKKLCDKHLLWPAGPVLDAEGPGRGGPMSCPEGTAVGRERQNLLEDSRAMQSCAQTEGGRQAGRQAGRWRGQQEHARDTTGTSRGRSSYQDRAARSRRGQGGRRW